MGNVSSDSAAAPSEQVVLETHDDLAVLRLGLPDEKVITLTEKRLQSLSAALADVKSANDISGLVLIGAYPRLYCAGADIDIIREVEDPTQGAELARRGQDVFNELAGLSCPTVAAIMGPCVGGGCELALACDYRLLVDGHGTRIGLPEVKLGIIPGFGGTQRLPRLIGLPQALKVILRGQVVPSRQALALHLADELASAGSSPEEAYELLEERAKKLVAAPSLESKAQLPLKEKLLTFTAIGRSLVYPKAKEQVVRDTQGHYPAPLSALDTAVYGLRHGLRKGLAAEADAIGRLIVTPESKSLIHVHTLTEKAGKLGRAAKKELDGLSVGIIGGGTMGSGIAAACIASGIPVTLVEPEQKQRELAQRRIHKSLERKRSLGGSERRKYLESLRVSADPADVRESSFLIEAVFEDFDVKRDVLAQLTAAVSKDVIIATNTSSLPISILAEGVPHADRIIGMHFFNPAERMPLVEIVFGSETSDRSIALTAAFTSMLGKYPVVVRDVPGFLVNRVLSPYLAEAAYLLGDGTPPELIDRQALAFGMPMGPIRLLDEIGLDIAAKVAAVMNESYGPRMEAPAFVAKLAESGRLGRKSGKGFYLYDAGDWRTDPELEDELVLRFDEDKVNAAVVQDRLFLSMVNEAVRCLDENVAGETGPDAAGQIDLASVMGTGFAPFRGGLMRYADSLGAGEVMKRLVALMEVHGERFAPAKGIRQRADQKKSFYEAV